ncbi:RtcB family protein [Salinifilum aidingensis]
MYTTVPGGRVPVRLWVPPEEVEPAAMGQLRAAAALPWVHGVAAMPDVHVGKGATVGSVLALRGAVAPAAVGVDIGCGVDAVRLGLSAEDLPADLGRLRRRIERAVPVGFGMHSDPVDAERWGVPGGWNRFWDAFDALDSAVADRRARARCQMGTLGGGNHFLEVCAEEEGPRPGRVWLVLHSGSRNIGKELAERHIEVARGLPHNRDLPDRDLAVLLEGTEQMRQYRHDLFWAQEYAWRNRAVMMALLRECVVGEFGAAPVEESVSCHHNYVAEEVHDGVEVLVTRKGAIRAGAGQAGVVPGSMGVGSYVVRGRGSGESFCSAAHGAGRRMSRAKARKTFSTADLQGQTRGVCCRTDRGVLDEIPAAYKDLDAVMAAQRDLVDPVARVRPLVCVKG